MTKQSLKSRLDHYLIRVYRLNNQGPKEAEDFLAAVHRQLLSLRSRLTSEQTIALEIVVRNQFIHFLITCDEKASDLVLGQLYAHFPGIEAERVDDYLVNVPAELRIAACELKLEKKDLYPIKTYKHMEQDNLVGLSGVFSKLDENEQLWIQIIVKPIAEHWLREIERFIKRSIRLTLEPTGGKTAIEAKFTKLFFQSKIKLACLSQNQSNADRHLSNLVNSFEHFDNDILNGFQGASIMKGQKAQEWFVNRQLSGRRFYLNAEELASLYHFPGANVPVANVIEVLSRKAPPPDNLPKAEFFQNKEISSFGLTNFRNQNSSFGIKRSDRPRHLYIVGKTGMGKSKLLELLMLADIYAGKGFAVLDPHGDLAEAVLGFIPKERVKDVVYFNPADEEFPIGFNPLAVRDRTFRQHIVTGFIGIFKKLFAFDWTPRLEHMLRYTTLALLDTQGATIVGIVRLLTNKQYRQEVIAQIEDPVVKNFWTQEFATWNEKFDNEAIVPLLNKVGEFISSPLVRNCLGQQKSSFTIEDIMENNKILIVNLASGRLGEENSSLLGSMIVTQIQQAAMARATLAEENRKDFYLYVDEFQNFATNAFATILSEARKYRLCLTMAHQYIDQLNDEVKKTVFGNVGSIVSFRVGSNDAHFLQTELAPVFTSDDLMNLDARQMCLKLSIDGKTAPPFSAQTITLPTSQTNYKTEIIDYCRRTYARPKLQVEQDIRSWEKDSQSNLVTDFTGETITFPISQTSSPHTSTNLRKPPQDTAKEVPIKFEEPIV